MYDCTKTEIEGDHVAFLKLICLFCDVSKLIPGTVQSPSPCHQSGVNTQNNIVWQNAQFGFAPIISRKIKENITLGVPILSNVECRDIAQQWLHSIGTRYKFKTFPFGSSSFFCEDHLESTSWKVVKINKVHGLPQQRILKKDAGPTIFIHRKH